MIKYLLCFLLSMNCFADCVKNVQPINKGDVASCTGYLFSPDAESDAYKATKLVDLYKEENQILNRRLNLYMQQSDVLAKNVARKENSEGIMRVVYFGLGALLTGYIAANVAK